MRTIILTGLVVAGLTMTAAASEQERRDTWQRSVESCLKEHDLANACHVTDAMGIYCAGKADSDKSVRRKCAEAGNAAVAPKRRVLR